MSDTTKAPPPSPVLPLPPLEYDVRYMVSLVRILTFYIQQQTGNGPLRGNTLTLASINPQTKTQYASVPTSDIDPITGLSYPSGTVWRDATAGNVLKIVP